MILIPESNGQHLKTKHVLEYQSKLMMNPSFFHSYLKLRSKCELLMFFVKWKEGDGNSNTIEIAHLEQYFSWYGQFLSILHTAHLYSS